MRKSSFFSKGGDEPAFFTPSSHIQAKLSVSKPDDPQEKEADSVAEKVMTMPEPEKKEEPIQRQPQEEEKQVQRKEEDKEEKVQTKCDACEKEDKEKHVHPKLETSISYISRKASSLHHSDVIQCSGRGPPAGHIPFEQSLSSSKGMGSAMPADTRTFMESRFGADFSGVRIHTGIYAEQMNSQVHAQAFTHGNDIYFNSGKFSPGTASGGLLLAHELTHTIQQGASKHSSPSAPSTVATKKMIHRSVEGAAVPQLGAAVEKAKSKEGKVNANKEGADGYREGWADLLDFFKTTFGPEQIISGRGNGQRGSVAEDDIKKKRMANGMLIVDPVNTSGTTIGSRDAMPSWCGIFVFWALNKAGVPMPKWKLGQNVVKPEAAYPPGYTPKPGDIAFRSTFSHYAIVSKVNGSKVSTVNGNTAGEDNLGGQVQERDHDISEWTGFFNPMVLKTGELGTGEGGEERTRSLDELRERLFGVRRKAEHENDPQEIKEDEKEEQEHKEVQTKKDLSNWSVDNKGQLQTAPPVQTKTEEQELQKKEEEKQEEPAQAIQQKELQFKTEGSHTIRPPPLVQLKGALGIQCSWLDRAWNAVSGFASEAASWVARGLDAAKEWLLRRVRNFVSNIPGYRLLSVILRRDPITGERVERSGMNILLAGLDILPLGFMFRGLMERLGILNDVANWVDGRINDLVAAASNIGDRFMQFWNRLSLDDIGRPQEVMNDVAGLLRYAIDQATGFMSRSASGFLEMVKRVMIREVSGFVRNRVPRLYPLLTVALGFNPETLQPVARNGTNILNALLEVSEEGREQRTQLTANGVLPRIAAWIDRGIAVFSTAYQQLMQAFRNLWGYVTVENLFHPIETFTRIYNDFAQPVSLVGRFIIDAAREIIRVIKDVLLRRLRDYARTVRGYHLVTVIIGRDPFTGENIPRTVHNLVRGFMSLMDGGEEQYQQLQQSGAIDQTVARINAAVARLNMTPAYIIQLFTSLWNSFSLRDLAHPIQAFQRIVARFGEPIGRLIAFVVEIVKIVVEVILRIMNFPFDLINNIITRAMQAFDLIKRDPIGFLKNLLRAIKQGFAQFFANIGTHLLNGLTAWLMSELRDANIPVLADFSLRGVIGWVLQVLGISMERIWEKLAQHPRIGPQRVARIRSVINTLEGIWTFIRDVQQRGMAAIWDKIQEQLSNLWNTILEAVRNWIMEQIVNRMVTRLLSMLDPTGIMAVINSAIALYSAIQSFIRYLREMLEIVNSFVEGTLEIAQGNPRRAANFLERTLARAVPIVIGFLANQVGLSGIGRRVGEMITRVRQMVDQALTWLVNRAVDTGLNLLDRLMAMGRSAVGGGGTPQERLDNALRDGQHAVNRFAGRRVGGMVLRPLLAAIRLRYGLQSLETVARGQRWAVRGRVNPEGETSTDAQVMEGAENAEAGEMSEASLRVRASAAEALSAGIGEGKTEAELSVLVSSVAERLRPQGLRRLVMGESTANGIRVQAEASPLYDLGDFRGQVQGTIPPGRSVTTAARIILSQSQIETVRDVPTVAGMMPRGGEFLSQLNAAISEMRLFTWNTTPTWDINNETHAERQFVEWLRRRRILFPFIQNLTIRNFTKSPCTGCATDLRTLLRDIQIAQRQTPVLQSADIFWATFHAGGGRTTWPSLIELADEGWACHAPESGFPPVPDLQAVANRQGRPGVYTSFLRVVERQYSNPRDAGVPGAAPRVLR